MLVSRAHFGTELISLEMLPRRNFSEGSTPSYLDYDLMEGIDQIIMDPVLFEQVRTVVKQIKCVNNELVANKSCLLMALFRVTWTKLAEILFPAMDCAGFSHKLFGHSDAQLWVIFRESFFQHNLSPVVQNVVNQ